jgi:hypothetical protein
MNVVLWVLQVVLALLYFSGGAYKLSSFDAIANQVEPLTRGATSALAVVEMVGAVLLIVPLAAHWKPSLTALAAAVLTVESFVLCVVYARHSLALAASNPLTWSVVMMLLAAFVALGRYKLVPPV